MANDIEDLIIGDVQRVCLARASRLFSETFRQAGFPIPIRGWVSALGISYSWIQWKPLLTSRNLSRSTNWSSM